MEFLRKLFRTPAVVMAVALFAACNFEIKADKTKNILINSLMMMYMRISR